MRTKSYKKIDLNNWERAEKFKYFTTAEDCVISVTCDVDITDFVAVCKSKGLKFYSAFICVVSRVINSDEHFRMGKNNDGELVVFDRVNPLFTDFVPDGETFNNLTVPYIEDTLVMYESIEKMREKYRGKEVMFPSEATDNMFSITSLPWVNYSSVELHYATPFMQLSPIVVWGKYKLKEGKLMLPLTLRIHHSVADGFHVARFFTRIDKVQSEIINCI